MPRAKPRPGAPKKSAGASARLAFAFANFPKPIGEKARARKKEGVAATRKGPKRSPNEGHGHNLHPKAGEGAKKNSPAKSISNRHKALPPRAPKAKAPKASKAKAPKGHKPAKRAQKPAKAKPPSLRVIPASKGRPAGVHGGKGRKPPKYRKRDLDKSRQELAALERKLAKARERVKLEERAKALSQNKRSTIVHNIRSSAEWLDTLAVRGREQGHRSKVTQAVNRDGTADLQINLYDWKEPLYKSITDYILDLNETMPQLGKGIKIRAQVRISADKIEEGKKGKTRYAYLPSVLGHRAVYFNYVRPESFGTLLFNMRDSVDNRLTEDGWRVVSISFDVRFDPRFMLERAGKKKERAT